MLLASLSHRAFLSISIVAPQARCITSAMNCTGMIAMPTATFLPVACRKARASSVVRSNTVAARSKPNLLRSIVPTKAGAHASRFCVNVATVEPAVQQQTDAAPVRPANPNALTFQAAIAKLQEYWASVGCAVWLPHNTEVGAGTMNPATFLRVLGPEPWNVCYAEPSIRPDDSRYGDNPNRVQRHTQFQVILKPDPGNPQELYLGSLEALGIDTRRHDVRFVEDNWESPVLGAWGLGWEVWLDGMEVTQFTYFQQAGGKPLGTPAVEITYGLERIMMNLQGVQHFKDIVYSPGITYGELFLQNEYEMSVYNLDEADVEDQRQRFALYEKEAKRLLEKRLPIPAFDHVLKLSHTFNIMDARGAVGVTERANCFAALRALARQVTGLWLERREELGHPLGTISSLQGPPAAPVTGTVAGDAAPFVLEIGSEELPPDDVEAAVQQLRSSVPALLDKLRLSYSSCQVCGTPRRVAVLVQGLQAQQPDVTERVRGPPAKVAFTDDGKPSKALDGFCRKNGVTVDQLSREADAKGVEYVWASVGVQGQTAAQVLTEQLPKLLASIAFTRGMRWNSDVVYSRPVRWLYAQHGPVVLPVQFAGLQASSTTRLLRNADRTDAQVIDAAQYLDTLAAAGIMLDDAARSSSIWERVQLEALQVGGVCPSSCRKGLLPEVTNLVEAPTVVLGSFDPKFLQLPRELLVMVMRKHQRYFPVYASGEEDAALLPHFITVANGPIDEGLVRAGNEAVLRARFEDATFFYNEDLKKRLEDFVPLLQGTLFQQALGTLLDKTHRVEQLIGPVAEALGLQEAAPVAAKAARLARADLASSTVMEMTALAGVMGRHYALQEGQPPEIAEAIFESVLPRQAGDMLPKSQAGILVGLADKLDSLVGLFAAGCAPTASTDPYALRRTAQGMLQTVLSSSVQADLRQLVALAAAQQPIHVTQGVQDAAVDFVVRRLEQVLIDEGIRAEAVRAALGPRGVNPALAAATARAVQAELAQGDASLLQRVLVALARPVRIIRGKDVDEEVQVNPELFELDEERTLHSAYLAARCHVSRDMPLSAFLAAAEALIAPTAAYFDKVFVMAEDARIRANRLALLRDMARLSDGVLDFAELPGF